MTGKFFPSAESPFPLSLILNQQFGQPFYGAKYNREESDFLPIP